MKFLIAIKSCHKHRPLHQAQRDTWIKDLPKGLDYKFFVGAPCAANAMNDEVFVNAPDAYTDLNHKLMRVLEWALGQGYDYLFYCDPDTYINPANIMSSGFEGHDYTGGANATTDITFASGGSGYWLSARAMRLVIADPIQVNKWHKPHVIRNGNDDVFVAETLLRKHGIPLHQDDRYLFVPGAVLESNTITYHCSSVRGWGFKYVPQMMYHTYEKQKGMSAVPTVSVVCPTGDRQDLIPMAIRCFLDQTFYSSEMVILDDGTVPTVVPYNNRIRYVRMDGPKVTIGEKRNMCAELARGSIICHFDDDDWSAPNRVAQQVRDLGNKSLTQYNVLSFYNPAEKWAARWNAPTGTGTSFCYQKEFWRHNRFENWKGGEDCTFYGRAKDQGQMDERDGHDMMVCRRHSSNTWYAGDMVCGEGVKRISVLSLPVGFLKAMGLPLPINPAPVDTSSIIHAHHGYCRKHKTLGCLRCTATGDF